MHKHKAESPEVSADRTLFRLRGVANWHSEQFLGPASLYGLLLTRLETIKPTADEFSAAKLRKNNKMNFKARYISFPLCLAHSLFSGPGDTQRPTSRASPALALPVEPYTQRHLLELCLHTRYTFFLGSCIWPFIKHTAKRQSSSSLPGMQLFSCQYDNIAAFKLLKKECH